MKCENNYGLPPVHLYNEENIKHRKHLLCSPYRIEKNIKRSTVLIYSLLYAEKIGEPITLSEYLSLNVLYDSVIFSDKVLKYVYTLKRLPETDVMGEEIIENDGEKIKIKDFYKSVTKDFCKTEFNKTKVIFRHY